MIVIGGIGRAEGAVVGTLIVTVIDRYFIDTGAKRILLVAILMLLLGAVHARRRVRPAATSGGSCARNAAVERRAARSTRRGEVLPEEAPDIRDKSAIYQRRFDNAQREHLKSLITDDLIEEHRRNPTGLHSENLERVMLYFRKSDLAGKYCVYAIEPFKTLPDRGAVGPARRAAPRRSTTASTRRSTTRTTRCSCAASTTCDSH